MAALPDSRLDHLAELYQLDKKTPAVFEFVDIAGPVKGAGQGAGLGEQVPLLHPVDRRHRPCGPAL